MLTRMGEHAITFKALLDLIAKDTGYTYSQRFGGIVFAPKNHPVTPTPKAHKIEPKKSAELHKRAIPELSFNNSTLREVAMFLTLRI